MIAYETGGAYFLSNILKIQGSVFPKALLVAVPNALLSGALVGLLRETDLLGGEFKNEDNVINNNAIWSGFSVLVGFLVVFRTQQAYSRFWEGTSHMHKMGAEWFDACSSMIAFCKHSSVSQVSIMSFQNMIIRLFSMLHAAALGEIEDSTGNMDDSEIQAFGMELIDAEAIDDQSLRAVCDCDFRVELLFQWIQQYAVENIKSGVLAIPPPILTRSFQELATGMVHFHESMKISNVPFPFPYAQTCDALLLSHWLIVPFVISQWCYRIWWAALFAGLQVFALWTLNLISIELENPFGSDPNDIDGVRMQQDFNSHLRMLIRHECQRIPRFSCDFHDGGDKKSPQGALQSQVDLSERAASINMDIRRTKSFKAIWTDQASPGKLVRRGTTRKLLKECGRSATWVGSKHLNESYSSLEGHINRSDSHSSVSTSDKKNWGSPMDAEQSHRSNLSTPSASSKKNVEFQQTRPNDHVSHCSASSSLSSKLCLEHQGNSPQIMLGKWEPVASHQMGVSREGEVVGLKDLGVRLGQIFQQIDNNEYAADAWEGIPDGADRAHSEKNLLSLPPAMLAPPVPMPSELGMRIIDNQTQKDESHI